MGAAETAERSLQPADVPLWREALLGVDWLSLRLSPVYYGIGVPRGDGAPVVVIPGFLGSDTYLMEMYYWLQRIGYKPYYSRIGRNAECPDVLRDRLFETLDRAHKESGRKLHLIGHSLGGLLARSAAVERPKQVAQVICLAAPFRDLRVHPMVLAAAGFVRDRIRGRNEETSESKADCYTGECTCAFANASRRQMPKSVKRAAIYTKTDGVIDWRSCVEPNQRLNTEVSGTHAGLAFNPQVYRRVAKLLAAGR
ncbi:MAG: alpha/beta hydrolase [Chloroflexi bacterium]|nr:alpha/beta hydrolase [Chloroflexota bacterium]